MTIWLWAGFVALIGLMLWLDLGLINRRVHRISAPQAIAWTCVCIALALAFNVLVYFMYEHHWLDIGVRIGDDLSGREAAQQFLAGWLVEYSLSLDNVLVIAVLFRYFRVPAELQHRVLFWGILGALVMRGLMIGAGTTLIRMFSWTEYLFGIILLVGAARMLAAGDKEPDPERSWVVRAARRVFTVSPTFEGARFITRVGGKRAVTPLFIVLIVIEITDVIFAVDSIPAILGITRDAFLVFTSNVFAIMGLRSMYFALAAVIDKFRYVKTSLIVVLAFVGVKMLIGHWVEIPTTVSLAIIGLVLGSGLAASAVAMRRTGRGPEAPAIDPAHAADIAWRRARRIVILVVGLTVVFILAPLTGLLPGPGGIPVAIAGLALLATEFVWARRLLRGLKARARRLQVQADAIVGDHPALWPVPTVVIAFGAAVAALIWREPQWWPMILLGASGPGMAVAYWAYATITKWSAQRSPPDRPRANEPPAEPSPDSAPSRGIGPS